jgi:YesN/AraC family two-component response regulator
MEVVGGAGGGAAAVEGVRWLRPDVALMDLRMPRLDGGGHQGAAARRST